MSCIEPRGFRWQCVTSDKVITGNEQRGWQSNKGTDLPTPRKLASWSLHAGSGLLVVFLNIVDMRAREAMPVPWVNITSAP